MVISDKQIMKLIMLARAYMDYLKEKEPISGDVQADMIWREIEPIIQQQSEKLRDVGHE